MSWECPTCHKGFLHENTIHKCLPYADSVKKPSALDSQIGGSHYKGDKIQHFTIAMENKIPWAEAAAMKYVMRHRKKNGVQDLDKALHYLLMAREYYYPDAPPFSLNVESASPQSSPDRPPSR